MLVGSPTRNHFQLIAFTLFAILRVTIGECDLECFHQGVCEIHDQVKTPHCNCAETRSGGYQGIRCKIPYLNCGDGKTRLWRCLNGGQCLDAGCHCPDGFEGQTCQTYLGDDEVDKIALVPGDDDEISNASNNNIDQDNEIPNSVYESLISVSEEMKTLNNKTNSRNLSARAIVGIILGSVGAAVMFTLIGYKIGQRGSQTTKPHSPGEELI